VAVTILRAMLDDAAAGAASAGEGDDAEAHGLAGA
jgi:hypothetical protein